MHKDNASMIVIVGMTLAFIAAAAGFIEIAAQEPDASVPAAPVESIGESLGDPCFIAKVEASLDPMEWRIEGRESLTVFNRTKSATSELVLLCMPNAFANSDALRDAGIPIGASAFKDPEIMQRLGYMDLKEVRLVDGHAQDPEAAIVGTEMRLPLPSPLEPGASVSLTLDFVVKLPDRCLGWIGRKGRHVDASMWFPKPALLTDGGWIAEPGHPLPLGDVEITLSLPASFTVDAGGRLMESHVENALKTVRFEGHMVHDLAWTADPGSIAEKNIYEGVEIVLYRQPFMEDKAEALLDAAKACLDYSHRFLTPYPYKRLVISTPPYGLGHSIESSMFISIGQHFPTPFKFLGKETLDPGLSLILSWTQAYFHGIIMDRPGSEIPLCDGLALYTGLKIAGSFFASSGSGRALTGLEDRVMERLMNSGFGLYATGENVATDGVCCGRLRPFYSYVNVTSVIGYRNSPFHDDPISASLLGYRVGALNRGKLDGKWMACLKEESAVVGTDGIGVEQRLQHKSAQGARMALGLISLERRLGEAKMQEIVRSFVNLHRFQSPGISAFLDNVQKAAGEQEASLAALLLHPDTTIDLAVTSISCRPAIPAQGFITQRSIKDPVAENPHHDLGKESCPGLALGELIRWNCPAEQDVSSAQGGSEGLPSPAWLWEVTVTNHGRACLPVTLQLSFEGGKTERMEWDGIGSGHLFKGSSAEKLESAMVDPDNFYVMDYNVLNNARSVSYQEQGVLFLTAWLQFWTQNYLNGWAFLN
ncbi:MAG: hypothetical protein ABIK28_04735 [Planctomycetota bacterium]